MKNSNKSIFWILALLLTVSLLFFAYQYLSNQGDENEKNPFAYNLDDYKKVDSKLISYREVDSVDLPGDELYAMAVNFNNNILISSDSKLLIYNNSSLEKEFNIEAPAYCIVEARDNKIYLGMQDHIEVYGEDGHRLGKWSSLGVNSRLTSLAILDENLFAADSGNRRVWRFDMNGQMLGSIDGTQAGNAKKGFIVPSPYFDVAAGPDSTLWIANPGEGRVQQYSQDGKLIQEWGKASMDIAGFSGCCNPSHISVMPDGSLVTSEKGLPRVKIYKPDGELESVVVAPDQFDAASYGCSGKAIITDIALTVDGKVLVLDSHAGKIRIFRKK